ncbi:MAG TPA: glycosyltransferase, partial [Nitrospiraceae bacterium]|nr:glycosyltransferase [Nitrospiraceae bacterium]
MMRLVIAAGGTGGHLYPAIALAREFLRQDPSTAIRFVGTQRGIEVKVLPHEGFDLTTITALPVMGLGVGQALVALLSLPKGIRQSLGILKGFRADLVMGIGGYTTPPVLLAAALMRVPRVILEPNAYPGKANTMLGPWVDRVFVAFEAAARHFKTSKVRVVGVPVRRAFLDSGKPDQAADPGRTLLVFGGSRGAHAINLAMTGALPLLMQDPAIRTRLTVIHQTGEADYDQVVSSYQAA